MGVDLDRKQIDDSCSNVYIDMQFVSHIDSEEGLTLLLGRLSCVQKVAEAYLDRIFCRSTSKCSGRVMRRKEVS